MVFLDFHADTLEKAFDDKSSIYDERYEFNISLARQCVPYIQCLASFVDTKYSDGFKRANDLISQFYKDYTNSNDMVLIKSREDIKTVIENKKVGIILTIENGKAINGDLRNIEKLYKLGIRIMSVTWNDDNELGCGAHTTNDKGLTELGKEYIKELEKYNILVDVSHLSKKSFLDVCKIAQKPIIATHSCTNKICKHTRNLEDYEIKKIASTGGMIGVCCYKEFLSKKSSVVSDDILKHFNYISNLVGRECVVLGSDFDGVPKNGLPNGIKNCVDLYNVCKNCVDRNQIEKFYEIFV